MITVYGEGRGFRVIWLLEEMGLPYRLRGVDLLADVSRDTEFLSINPAGYIPALVDGDTVMVESVAIMEYLLGRYGPSPLAPVATAPEFGAYQQFLHLGEAGLMMPVYMSRLGHFLAPEGERDDWTAREGVSIFQRRLALVTRRLADSPYLAGEAFTAADISVAYSLNWARRHGMTELGERVDDYLAGLAMRDGYRRARAASASG